ncbi:MAG: kinase/pyrophosphorylase [Bdellovibrionales bacterium]|nr:kinase/pyrophosphorylase [Bdellovibrionales bacterium]
MKKVYIVSDGTGETAAQMVKAAMIQFQKDKGEELDVYFTRHKNVRETAQIEGICEEAADAKALIIYTIVSPEVRTALADCAKSKGIECVDLIGPLLAGLAGHFGYEPKSIAGLLHNVNEAYFRRIDAMEYTVSHDDGRDLSRLGEADLVILGISRTSKTPLSMYLSQQGWKVVNIPIIHGFQIPDELFQIDQRKIICLTIDPENLTTIRRNRLSRLGQNRGGEYADPDKVNDEIVYADEIFKKNRKWAVFNVTGKALEETAAEIIRLMASRRLTPMASLENTPSDLNPRS